jgi:hypothetical protein
MIIHKIGLRITFSALPPQADNEREQGVELYKKFSSLQRAFTF